MSNGPIFVTMKKLILLAACLLALTAQPVLAQTGGADVVVVRVLEGNPRDVRIIVSYSEKKSETTTVKSTLDKEGQIAINEACQQVIQKLYRDGYTLKNTYSASPYTHGFIFVKGQ
jgi:hypothetical protein